MTRRNVIYTVAISAVVCLLAAERAHTVAQAANPVVRDMTILSAASPTAPLQDTQQLVLAPDGSGINSLAGTTTDQHSSIFPPGSLSSNAGYLFFVASGSKDAKNVSIGAMPLISVPGKDPAPNGQWTLREPDDWGAYVTNNCPPPSLSTVHGDVFLAPHALRKNSTCPTGDETFDLTYAAPGAVVADPTAPSGHLLMVYEGANGCIGSQHQHPVHVGIATSNDNGRTWPAYCGSPYGCGDATPPVYKFYPLPTEQNPTQGPNQSSGAWGNQVCRGNDCNGANPPTYGRYQILRQEGSVPSAFVAGGTPYLYVVHQTPGGDLSMSRVPLNGGTERLTKVEDWNGAGWCSDRLSGCNPGPILRTGGFEECGGANQKRWQGSINYVDQTRQYLLTFVCGSDGDPATGQHGSHGAAWFWTTTSDLSTQNWSTPNKIAGHAMQASEIAGTWNTIDTCTFYNGWYPTFMSLAPAAQGHLASTGYVFYLWGNVARCSTPSPGHRQYASRFFTMTIQ